MDISASLYALHQCRIIHNRIPWSRTLQKEIIMANTTPRTLRASPSYLWNLLKLQHAPSAPSLPLQRPLPAHGLAHQDLRRATPESMTPDEELLWLWLSRVGLKPEALEKWWSIHRKDYLKGLQRIRASVTSEWITSNGSLSRLSADGMSFEQTVTAAERDFTADLSEKTFLKFGQSIWPGNEGHVSKRGEAQP